MSGARSSIGVVCLCQGTERCLELAKLAYGLMIFIKFLISTETEIRLEGPGESEKEDMFI